MTIPYVNQFFEDIVENINEWKQIYGYDNIVILSNSAGSTDDLGNDIGIFFKI